MFRYMSFIFTFLALSGCANNYLKPDGVSTASLTPSNGVLIGSFARNPNGKAYYSQAFHFKDLRTNELRSIKAQHAFNPYNGKTPENFSTDDSQGSVFAFSLPAGQYTLTNFRLFQASSSFQQSWTSKDDFSIPFEVHPNTTNYLGEIKLEPMDGKNIFGWPVHAGGVWLISDQQTRDVEIIKRLYPEVPVNPVVSVLPVRKEVFTPLVVLPSELEQYRKKQE